MTLFSLAKPRVRHNTLVIVGIGVERGPGLFTSRWHGASSKRRYFDLQTGYLPEYKGAFFFQTLCTADPDARPTGFEIEADRSTPGLDFQMLILYPKYLTVDGAWNMAGASAQEARHMPLPLGGSGWVCVDTAQNPPYREEHYFSASLSVGEVIRITGDFKHRTGPGYFAKVDVFGPVNDPHQADPGPLFAKDAIIWLGYETGHVESKLTIAADGVYRFRVSSTWTVPHYEISVTPEVFLVRLQIQTKHAAEEMPSPLRDAWVYAEVGAERILLRTDADGFANTLREGGNALHAWDYVEPHWTTNGSTLGLFFSRTALPCAMKLFEGYPAVFRKCVVSWKQLTNFGVAVVADVSSQISRPSELAIWPLRWEMPTKEYMNDGLGDGASLLNADGVALGDENDAAPAAALSRRPQERGLVVEGTVLASVTQAKVVLIGPDGAPIPLREERESTAGVSELPVKLGAPVRGRRPFSAVVRFADASRALGALHVAIVPAGGPLPELVLATCWLTGVQIALVDDHLSGDDGSARGPFPRATDEHFVVHFENSPVKGVEPAAMFAEARARRMTVYEMRHRTRQVAEHDLLHPLEGALPEMPLWMAELHLVGLDAKELFTLRRKLVPTRPTSLHATLDWNLTLHWQGPDGRRFDKVVAARQDARISLGPEGEIDGLQPDGSVNGFRPRPKKLPYPVDTRRVPKVWISRDEPWSRWGEIERPSLVIEWQPELHEMIEHEGNDVESEWFFGGDCALVLENFQLEGEDIGVGVSEEERPGEPLFDPRQGYFAALPTARVRGRTPTEVDVWALLDAVVERSFKIYKRDARNLAVPRLSLDCWQWTIRQILLHETRNSGGPFHFCTKSTHTAKNANGGSIVRHGIQHGMPNFGFPHGYGLGQLDNPKATDGQVWSFYQNICEIVRRVLVDYGNAAVGSLRERRLDGLDGTRSRAVLRREIVRRYNGGTEFEWRQESNDFWVHPRNLRNGGFSPCDNRTYPNQVLGTSLTYAIVTPRPPGPACRVVPEELRSDQYGAHLD